MVQIREHGRIQSCDKTRGPELKRLQDPQGLPLRKQVKVRYRGTASLRHTLLVAAVVVLTVMGTAACPEARPEGHRAGLRLRMQHSALSSPTRLRACCDSTRGGRKAALPASLDGVTLVPGPV